MLLLIVRRREADAARVLVDGSLSPAPLEPRVGVRYRPRLVDIHTFRRSMIACVLRDSMPVTWRAVAKDRMAPPERATTRPAVQQVGNGETYDFELVPTAPGDLRFTVSAAAGPLLASMPILVRGAA